MVGGCSAIDIFEWLRKKDDGFGFDLDADLTPRERAEAVA